MDNILFEQDAATCHTANIRIDLFCTGLIITLTIHRRLESIPEEYKHLRFKICSNLGSILVDPIGYCEASRGSHMNDIMFHS